MTLPMPGLQWLRAWTQIRQPWHIGPVEGLPAGWVGPIAGRTPAGVIWGKPPQALGIGFAASPQRLGRGSGHSHLMYYCGRAGWPKMWRIGIPGQLPRGERNWKAWMGGEGWVRGLENRNGWYDMVGNSNAVVHNENKPMEGAGRGQRLFPVWTQKRGLRPRAGRQGLTPGLPRSAPGIPATNAQQPHSENNCLGGDGRWSGTIGTAGGLYSEPEVPRGECSKLPG